MGNNTIKEKSFEFALRIVKMYKFLTEKKSEYVLSKQVLRSGTSVGANVREAEQAQSTADFIYKLNIALKEANETEYWIELLFQSEYIEEEHYKSIMADCSEINKILISIIKTMKKKNTIN